MKTAISIPDNIFDEAEQVAKQLQISRSELYAKALAEFLEKQRREKMQEKFNEVYAKVDSSLDPALMQAQIASIWSEDEW